jgi:hypothetical protein
LPSLFFYPVAVDLGLPSLFAAVGEDVGCLNTFKYIKIIFFYILKDYFLYQYINIKIIWKYKKIKKLNFNKK